MMIGPRLHPTTVPLDEEDKKPGTILLSHWDMVTLWDKICVDYKDEHSSITLRMLQWPVYWTDL